MKIIEITYGDSYNKKYALRLNGTDQHFYTEGSKNNLIYLPSKWTVINRQMDRLKSKYMIYQEEEIDQLPKKQLERLFWSILDYE